MWVTGSEVSARDDDRVTHPPPSLEQAVGGCRQSSWSSYITINETDQGSLARSKILGKPHTNGRLLVLALALN